MTIINKIFRPFVCFSLLSMIFFVSPSTSEAAGLEPISGTVLNDQVLFELNGAVVTPVGDDGNPVLPLTYKGTTYLPVRAMGYLLGLGIGYENSTETVLIASSTDKAAPKAKSVNKTNKLIPVKGAVLNGNLSFKIDGKKAIPLGQDGAPVLPITYKGTTYLPVRGLGNLLGIGVDYNGTTNTVILNQGGKTYTDDQGNQIKISAGFHGFADKVVDYTVGNPAPTEAFSDPSQALGEPNYKGTSVSDWNGFVSLGGGGQITLEFTKVYLIDQPGPDLHVFEVGPSIEAMELEISKDGKHWIHIGEISGGNASVDIAPFVSIGDKFSFVRLTDLKVNPSGATAGADVDAVAVIHSVSSDEEEEEPKENPNAEGNPETYTDGQGNEVVIPYGAMAFAGKNIEYIPGIPKPSEIYSDPSNALGEPDYNDTTWEGFVSLGGGGQIVLEFTEVYVVDGPGADLHVFEVGPSVEAMELDISKDGKTWINIGEISGGTAQIDISPYVEKDDKFSFVRLTDLKSNATGSSAGADIDAIAAVNALIK